MMKRGILLLTGSMLIALVLQGQHRQVLLGDSLYDHYSYAKAVRHYEKALKKEDRKWMVHERLGNSFYQLRDYQTALSHYNQALSMSDSWNEESRWHYLQVQRTFGNDEEVRKYLALWGQGESTRAAALEKGIQGEILFFMDSAVWDISLSGVNSDRADFAPAYYKDGLVFASSRKEDNSSSRKYHWDGSYYLDLYYSSLKPGPSGEIAIEPAGENTVYHDGPVVFYDNYSRVIFTRNELGKSKDDIRTLVLMEARVGVNGNWSEVTPLSVNEPGFSFSHPALSTDGQYLYFVSDKSGGYGGTDIWRSRRTGDSWDTPENLGPSINTPGNEMFPYLYGEELFFASDGHPGLGGLDVFIAGEFAEGSYMIRNAGYPINTRKDDFGLITRNGRQGYFSSNRAGQDDIYAFSRDRMVVDIFYEDRQGVSLDSVLTVMDGREIQMIGERTHLYLPLNSVTGMHASREGYSDTTFSVATDDSFYKALTVPLTDVHLTDRGLMEIYPIASEFKVDFYLATPEALVHSDHEGRWLQRLDVREIERDEQMNELDRIHRILDQNGFDVHVKDTITSIFFDFDKYAVRETEKSNLSRLIDLLDRYPEAKIIISAHTDARGSNAYNDKLATRRANATRDYLIANGISSTRIEARSFGERQLWIECEQCTEEQHQLNRRATFGVNKEE